MAENVIIRIREDGSLKVVRNFKNIGDEGRKAASGVGVLQRALGLLGGVLAVRSVIQYSDAYTALQNRIKLVTKGSAELRAVTEELRKTANETRTSFQNTGEFYARAALSARNLGVSQKQLLDLTRSVNQAIILSGATAVEAEKGLIQFAQGIASGTLRGDELRSVLEQLPLVADVIAKQLGVTRGELRALGRDGKITADVIFEAFKNSREELEKAFKSTTPTIQQSFAVLRNEVVVFIGRMNEGTGAARTFSQFILELSKHVEEFARLVAAGALTVGIQQFTGALRGLFALIQSNPIGLIVTGITLAVSTLITFSDRIGVAGNGLITLQDVAIGFFKVVLDALKSFVENWKRGFEFIVKVLEPIFGDIKVSFRDILMFIARAADRLIGVVEGNWLALREGIVRTAQVFELLFKGDISGAAKAATALGGSLKDAFLTGFNRDDIQLAVSEAFDTAAARAAQRLGARAKELRTPAVDLTTPGTRTERPAGGGGGKAPKFTIEMALAELRREGELLQMNNREREREEQLLRITDALRKAGTPEIAILGATELFTNLIKRNESLKEEANLLHEIKGPREDLIAQQDALNVLYSVGKITLDEYLVKLAELNQKTIELPENVNTAHAAWAGFLKGMLDGAQSLNASLQQTGAGTLQAFGDALSATFQRGGDVGDFFQSFKANLSDVLGQLAQLTLKLLIIQGITGLGGGGFLASIGVTATRAFGGTVQGGRDGRMFRAGERGPENVFVGPGQQAAVQPTQQAQPTSVNVIAVADPSDVPAFLNSTEGGHTIVQLVSRNRNQIRAALGV